MTENQSSKNLGANGSQKWKDGLCGRKPTSLNRWRKGRDDNVGLPPSFFKMKEKSEKQISQLGELIKTTAMDAEDGLSASPFTVNSRETQIKMNF